ncbi:MAG: hypothetical protein R3B45_16770 [Bdellovibrionota bacterium]
MKNEDAFDVVIIGSGYGGSVTAARLAESGLFKHPATKEPTKETSIAILERG